MECKHYEQNQKERKCSDYYYSHGNKKGCYCRLKEWKQKRGVCPYDKTIFSITKKIKRDLKNKTQTTIQTFK